MNFEQQLDIYLRARFTLIVLVTPEEERALQAIKAVCERTKRPCLTWDVADLFQWLTGTSGALPPATDAVAARDQAQRVFSRAVVTDGLLDDRDIHLVTEEKKLIIRESEALEFYEVTASPSDVGGLGVLKEWLRLRERAFTEEARNYGLPSPK